MSQRLLMLTKTVPYPLRDGESVVIYYELQILRSLGWTVDLFCLNPSRNFVKLGQETQLKKEVNRLKIADIDTDIRYTSLIASLFKQQSYHISRFYDETAYSALKLFIADTKYDVVQFETLFTLPYLPLFSDMKQTKKWYRPHNVEGDIWSDLSTTKDQNPIKKWYYRKMSNELISYDIQKSGDFDRILTINDQDANWYMNHSKNKKVEVVPPYIGDYIGSEEGSGKSNTLNIGFIGTMDWLPNRSGIQWFIDHVWPTLESERYKLIIAGKNGKTLKSTDEEHIHILDYVDNIKDFYNMIDVLIVPIFAASGTRIKIVEALKYGKPVISTSKGLQGLGNLVGDSVQLANSATQFKMSLNNLSTKDQQIDVRKTYDNNFSYVNILQNYKAVYGT